MHADNLPGLRVPSTLVSHRRCFKKMNCDTKLSSYEANLRPASTAAQNLLSEAPSRWKATSSEHAQAMRSNLEDLQNSCTRRCRSPIASSAKFAFFLRQRREPLEQDGSPGLQSAGHSPPPLRALDGMRRLALVALTPILSRTQKYRILESFVKFKGTSTTFVRFLRISRIFFPRAGQGRPAWSLLARRAKDA